MHKTEKLKEKIVCLHLEFAVNTSTKGRMCLSLLKIQEEIPRNQVQQSLLFQVPQNGRKDAFLKEKKIKKQKGIGEFNLRSKCYPKVELYKQYYFLQVWKQENPGSRHIMQHATKVG